MLAQPCRFAGRALGQMVVDDGPDEPQANDQKGDRCDRHREPFGRDRLRGHRDGRIGHERDGGHRGEVQADDAENQEARAQQAEEFAAPARREHRKAAEHGADDERGDDVDDVPLSGGGKVKGRHAGIVHGADAETDDRAAQHSAVRRPAKSDAEPEPGHEHGDHRRQRGQFEVIRDGQTRAEGKLGHEMRRPHAASGDEGRGRKPQRARQARAGIGARFQAERRVAADDADHRRKNDEPEIVLICDATEDTKHGGTLAGSI